LRFAIKKINITPTEPSYLSGQINRIAKHNVVLDPLYATLIVLEQEDQTFALLGFDLLMLDESLVNLMRSAISLHTKIPYKNILFMPSHTHAGPEVLEEGLFGIKLQEVLPGYRESLIEQVKQISIMAFHELQDVHCYFTKVELKDLFTNRNDPNKPIDRYLRLVAFKNNADEIIGSFANIACHPTILGPENTAISSDFFGIVRDAIQDHYHFPILISNGAEGDISNRHTRISSDIHEMQRVREKLKNQFPLSLDWVPVEEGLEFFQNSFTFKTILQKERMQAMIDHNDQLLQSESNLDKIKLLNASNTVLKAYHSRPTEGEIDIEYKILKLGQLILCFLPMELFSSHYLDLKAKMKHELLIIGLSNISIGYLVDKEAYGETYEGMTSPLPWLEIERFLNQIKADLIHLDK